MMEELNNEVQMVRNNTVNAKSKSVYLYGIIKYVLWLHDHKPGVVEPSLRALLDTVATDDTTEAYKQKQSHVKLYVESDRREPPLDLVDSNVHDFECFLMSLRKKDGKKPGKSLYGSMRSSIFHLYRLYDVQMPENYDNELRKFFKGLKRSVVRRQQESGDSLVEGKMNFQFSFYHKLCKAMPDNSVSIRYEHLEWDEDSLAIWFGHMKNDQEGDRQRDPRHLYANPMQPDIYPIYHLQFTLQYSDLAGARYCFPVGTNTTDTAET
ncbi:hypothetical protein PPTG_04389 [Phytophthora nicotianae INRA-310]|uniref:Uncharacterized protein n=1 Tax=Phytophthora nicotianae (strain INRA-310) TaxID=761204 RepID=W2R112_PHYN3|nr:hypothetical protein PPTG_04389 [Phytophthora nicotianae INRA-310]ETN18946.1 hypothetical protein PPTG_04389 [Phytophthora nicotianae INRA-310]